MCSGTRRASSYDKVLGMIEWVMEGLLARSCRPGFNGVNAPVLTEEIDRWLAALREIGIKSILCLLANEQLTFCPELPTDLIAYYLEAGFQVVHIPVKDFQWPPLSTDQLGQVWRAYQQLPKPVLVHCNAGISRTGSAVEYIQERLTIEEGMS